MVLVDRGEEVCTDAISRTVPDTTAATSGRCLLAAHTTLVEILRRGEFEQCTRSRNRFIVVHQAKQFVLQTFDSSRVK